MTTGHDSPKGDPFFILEVNYAKLVLKISGNESFTLKVPYMFAYLFVSGRKQDWL